MTSEITSFGSGFTTCRTTVFQVSDRRSLHQLVNDGETKIKGSTDWKKMMDSPGYQNNCNKEGFNIPPDADLHSSLRNGGAKVRIGILYNNENDCSTPDAGIGIGLSLRGNKVAGGAIHCCQRGHSCNCPVKAVPSQFTGPVTVRLFVVPAAPAPPGGFSPPPPSQPPPPPPPSPWPLPPPQIWPPPLQTPLLCLHVSLTPVHLLFFSQDAFSCQVA